MTGRRGTRVVVLAVSALAVAGCATITYEAGLVEEIVAMNRLADSGTYERVGTFEAKQRPVFAIAQLITLVDADVEEAVLRELQRSGGDAVINLRIHEENDLIDVVVGLIAGSWVNTRSVTLEGDVVRWTVAVDDGEIEESLASQCRPMDVPTATGGTRPGHLCLSR